MAKHDVYSRLTSEEREVVDMAWEQVENVLTINGFGAAGDDRAEELVEAIAKYLQDSKQ